MTDPAPHGPPRVGWVADGALRVVLGDATGADTHRRVRAAYERLRRARIPASVDVTAAYASLLVTFDLRRLEPLAAERAVAEALDGSVDPAPPPPLARIPVCYDADLGPDLEDVAHRAGLDVVDAIALHSGASYVVRFLGFSPGFPYLAGLPDALHTPRLDRPRIRVPAGSVAIAGAQAGVYPRATPGGWRLLGRTPVALFDPNRDPPAALAIGQPVRFEPIPRDRFDALAKGAGA